MAYAGLGSVTIKILHVRGRHSTEIAFALLAQVPRVGFSAFPRFLLKILMLQRSINRPRLEENEQRHDSVNITHLALVILALQKNV